MTRQKERSPEWRQGVRTLPGILLLIVGCNSGPAPSEPARREPEPSPATSSRRPASPPATALDVVEITTGGATKDATLPMIVAIHGLGDRPEDFGSLFQGFEAKARVVLPRAPDSWGGGFSWFPFRPDADDRARAEGIAKASELVATTIARLVMERPTRGKPIVTGFSQGGMLSFAIAARHPDAIAAAFPIGGVLPEPLWPRGPSAGGGLEVVALHGESDTRVPIGPTRNGVEALARAGFQASIQTFPGVGHGIPAPMRTRLFELLASAVDRG